jgi:hypothetical protein
VRVAVIAHQLPIPPILLLDACLLGLRLLRRLVGRAAGKQKRCRKHENQS